MKNFDRYKQAIQYLEGLSNIPTEKNYMKDRSNPTIYLKRMKYFLGLLNHPEKNRKYIHVTGTAGKGTGTTMLHEILFASGSCVGSFTSPFVTTSIEKIRVNDSYISPNEFVDIVEQIQSTIDHAYLHGPYGRPSYFEIFLAIALIYFKKKNCSWIVLEVGAGGRYDATNIIKQPRATIITNIDYDHTQFLGKTLKKIAHDKAGIIKPGGMFFTSEQRPTLVKMFKETCKKNRTVFHQIPRQKSYQLYNQNLAIAVGEKIGIKKQTYKKEFKTHICSVVLKLCKRIHFSYLMERTTE